MKDNVYLLRNDVALESFDDEALLFQAADCKLLRINKLAREVLMRLDGAADVDMICGEIAEEYGEVTVHGVESTDGRQGAAS